MEFIYKKLYTYSYLFQLQSPSKYSPFDAIHLLRSFFHCSKQFLNLSILVPFSASAIFCFTYSTSAKHFPLRTSRETQSHSGWDWVNREGGVEGSCCFGSKTDEHSVQWGMCACKSPIMKWANALKESSKQIHWSQMQLLTTKPAGALIQMDF